MSSRLLATGLTTCVAIVALAGSAARPAQAARAALPHVTMIGDSAAAGLGVDARAVAILRRGVDLDLELAPCRRVDGESCPWNGVRPPTVVQLAEQMGAKLGPTVIVSVGYNDHEDEYARDIENGLQALKKAGVKRVLWTTLHAVRRPHLNMNDDIVAAAGRHPEMTVVDWNFYARSHPEWFQDDGIHLSGEGPRAFATLLRKSLVDLGVIGNAKPTRARPLRVRTASLPAAVKGKKYAARLVVAGGRPPYQWSTVRRLPTGLHLRPNGWIWGVPTGRAGSFAVELRVSDASGRSLRKRFTLRIRS